MYKPETPMLSTRAYNRQQRFEQEEITRFKNPSQPIIPDAIKRNQTPNIPKNISVNRVKHNMSYKYLHINSAHLSRSVHEDQYTVNLLDPIQKATQFELISFSTANDIHNIQEPNNRFQMYFRRYVNASTDTNQLFNIQVDLEPGFYTHEEMLLEIERLLKASSYYDQTLTDAQTDNSFVVHPDQFVGSTFTAQTTYSVALKFTVLSSGKTEISLSQRQTPASNDIKYGFLVYPFHQFEEYFEDSLLHRLGFTRAQVYYTDELVSVDQVFFDNTANGGSLNTINITNNKSIDPGRYSANAVAVSNNGIKSFFRSTTSATERILTSSHLAFETHSSLILTCDLIHDIQTTTHHYKKLGKTEYSSILAYCPIETNRASWVHHVPAQPHPHKIDNPLIRNFKIGIMNPYTHKHLKDQAHKNFNLTLKIYTMDDETIPNTEFFRSIANGSQNFSYRE